MNILEDRKVYKYVDVSSTNILRNNEKRF